MKHSIIIFNVICNESSGYLKTFCKKKFFSWGHWSSCFGLLVMPVPRVSKPLFAVCVQYIPQIHLWCGTHNQACHSDCVLQPFEPFWFGHQCLWICLEAPGSKRLGCHADRQEVSRCCTRCECEEYIASMEGSTQTRDPL